MTHRLTSAEYRKFQESADHAILRSSVPVSPAALCKLQRNAADPVRARKRKAPVGRERDVQRAVEDYLRAEGLVPIPINSGAAAIIGGRACLKGLPDVVTWLPEGRSIGGNLGPPGGYWAVPVLIECKRPKGGRYSKEQLAFRHRAIMDGCIWIGATCLEDVRAVLPPKGRR